MRISIIDPSLFTLPYDRALLGGLQRQGHEVTLHGRRAGADDNATLGANLAVDFYRMSNNRIVAALPSALRLGIKGVDHALSMAGLRRRLRREKPDVIHFQWLALPLVDQMTLDALAQIAPLVLTVHDTDPFNGAPSSRLQSHGYDNCLSKFARLIVHTEQGRVRLLAQGIAPERVVVLPHGLLTEPVSGPDDPMTGRLTFTLFGKIKPYKGADLLIQAFAAMPKMLRDQAQIHIIGKPYMDLSPLHDLAATLGVAESVRIEPRFVRDEEVDALFGPGVVAAFPYREIEASGVLFVALGRGRPVVASRLGSFGEILLDGREGHLVPPDNLAALSQAMAHLIADRDFAAECAYQARLRAAVVPSWQDIAHRTETVYRDAGARVAIREALIAPISVARASAEQSISATAP
jgi:glycosyltransferase involved in cell wall biosynthesis